MHKHSHDKGLISCKRDIKRWCKCMKKSLILCVMFLVITNIVFISTTMWYKTKLDKEAFKVYSFQGEGTNIKITDGLIIISPDKHVVSGGNIQYIGTKQEKIQSYSKAIYLDKQGDKNIVLCNSISFENDDKEMSFTDEFLLNKSIGEISSQQLFSEDQIGLIKENLYFALEYSTVDGQRENFIVKLNVKEVNMNEIE